MQPVRLSALWHIKAHSYVTVLPDHRSTVSALKIDVNSNKPKYLKNWNCSLTTTSHIIKFGSDICDHCWLYGWFCASYLQTSQSITAMAKDIWGILMTFAVDTRGPWRMNLNNPDLSSTIWPNSPIVQQVHVMSSLHCRHLKIFILVKMSTF